MREAAETSVKATMEKYALSPATFYSWKSKYKEQGADGLERCSVKVKINRIAALEKENQMLKKQLERVRLESAAKNEKLKEMYPHLGDRL